MEWSEEKYVKLYVRDTVTWLSWPWQARALWPALMRKLDGAGMLECGNTHPAKAVSLMVLLPLEVVEVGLAAMLESSTLERVPNGLLAPKFLEGQEARKSDALRQREARARRREDIVSRKPTESGGSASHGVTRRHETSQPVTLQPSPAQPSPEETTSVPQAGPAHEVFKHWQRVLDHPRAAFEGKRKRAVEARLKAGRTAEELKQAIDGCAKTPHNLGQNERGERYDDLELICRDDAQVERFIRNAKSPPRPQNKGALATNNADWTNRSKSFEEELADGL